LSALCLPASQAPLEDSVPSMLAKRNGASSDAFETTLIDPLVNPEWDRLVLLHPDHTIFHTAAWANVLSRTYNHRPAYLHCSHEGAPVALIPMMEVESRYTGRRGVSLPFTDFCGPLIFGECNPDFLIETLSNVARQRGWRHFELRGEVTLNGPAGGRLTSASAQKKELSATPAVTFYGHTLDLRENLDVLRGKFASSVRRAIGKAERQGLTVEIARTEEAMHAFYRLHSLTRRRHGLPPQPLAFFTNIYEELIRPGLGFLVLRTAGPSSPPPAVFFQLGKKAVYKFGASDEKFQESRANNLVMWEAIRQLSSKGIRSPPFLAAPSLDNHGLRRFKAGWGTTEEEDHLLPARYRR
jgi:hypothetical protein